MINTPDEKNGSNLSGKLDATSITATFGLKQKFVSEMIYNEDFRKVTVGLLTIYESENWLFLEKAYIPKNLVSHLYVYNTGWIEAARIYLLNGSYVKMNYSKAYGKVLAKMLPHAFIVKTDRMELLDMDDNMESLKKALAEHNLTIEDVITNRPEFFSELAKNLEKKSRDEFDKSLASKSKLSRFLLSKLS